MYLKYTGEKEVIVDGRTIKTEKYEMRLSNIIASLFWPYKYYYWYDPDTKMIVKYKGADKDKFEEVLELKKINISARRAPGL